MFRSVWEIVTDVKPVLPENAYPRMETTEVEMVTVARLLLLNAAPLDAGNRVGNNHRGEAIVHECIKPDSLLDQLEAAMPKLP